MCTKWYLSYLSLWGPNQIISDKLNLLKTCIIPLEFLKHLGRNDSLWSIYHAKG